MIKTYNARVKNNNISYLLEGKHGNQMRYNFTSGNVITNKYPSLTLRNRYAQELLESSLLFANNTIVLERSEEEFPGELEKLKAEQQEAEKLAESNGHHDGSEDCIEIQNVRSDSDLIAFANEKDKREGSRVFKTAASALKWATEHNYKFPNYK